MRRFQFVLWTFLVLAIVSCKNQETQYKIASLKIVDPLNNELFTLNDSGAVTVRNQKLFIVTGKGELKNKSGKVLLFFSGDTLKDETNTNLAMINSDGEISSLLGKKLAWDENGKLNIDGNSFSIIPKNSAAKRFASTLVLSHFMPGLGAEATHMNMNE